MANDSGWYTQAKRIDSPNCDQRPDVDIDLVVIHNITVPPNVMEGDGIIRLFTNQETIKELANLKVSAHFLIRRDGQLLQFVSCLMRAWHCGKSQWQKRTACNDFSIGIELEGTDDIAYTNQQYDQLIKLVLNLKSDYSTIQHVAGHSDIAPKRKTDPGPSFDWQRLFNSIGNEFNACKH